MARQNGVDLADVTGHGPGGIITREDLAAHLAGGSEPQHASATGAETRTPVRGVQKHMAEAMTRSVATAPQACVFLTVDATATVDLVDGCVRIGASRVSTSRRWPSSPGPSSSPCANTRPSIPRGTRRPTKS